MSMSDPDYTPNSPIALPGPPSNLWTTDGAEKALAAAGAYTNSDVVVDVRKARQIHVEIFYRAGGAGGYPILLPLVSIEDEEPASADDAWTFAPVTDGAVSTTILTGAVPTNADWTQDPGRGLIQTRGAAVQPCAACVDTDDRVRESMIVRVDTARWFQIAVAEKGNTASPGSLRLRYSLTV